MILIMLPYCKNECPLPLRRNGSTKYVFLLSMFIIKYIYY